MGAINGVILLLVLTTISIVVIVSIAIDTRKRKQEQSRTEKVRPLVKAKTEVEEVPEPVEEEEPQEVEEVPEPVEEEEPKTSVRKGKRTAPIERGGRPRVAGKIGEEEVLRPKQYQWRPEIVCWQRERWWFVGVEVPEDLIDKGLKILQNSSSLMQDEFNDCCWILKKADIPVEIRWEETESVKEYKIPLDEMKYLLFKLSGSDQNWGCCVRSPSFGSYLVIIPETWERDTELSGLPPVSPQPVTLKGYRGHFFDLVKGGDRKIAFRNEKKELMLIEYKKSRFELVGNLLFDSSENLGPLFGSSPIRIRSLNSRGWEDVGTIVIGEEGGGKGRWRTAFNPEQGVFEQELPSEVVARQGGWYFIRFYDTNDDLIESLDFRFVSGLKDIKMTQSSLFPSEEGHSTVSVEFSHDSNFNIHPKDGIEGDVEITREENTSILTIPPRHNFDETCWIVGPHKGPQVEVNILVERIWWGVGDDDETPSEWKDKPISLSRDDFAPTSNKAIYLRFPKPRWIDAVLVGFEQDRARSFSVSVGERTVGIPLRDFGDSIEIENEDQDALLTIWINRRNETHKSTLASLPSSVPDSIGYGRKRRAVAKAILRKGSPQIEVNGRPLWEYFELAPIIAKRFLRRLLQLEEVSEALLNFQVQIIVIGSSPNTMQQAKAATHALARALMALDPDLRQFLKHKNDFGGVRVGGLPTRRKK